MEEIEKTISELRESMTEFLSVQTYGEAVAKWPWLKEYCDVGHEWDNRRNDENFFWLINQIREENQRLRVGITEIIDFGTGLGGKSIMPIWISQRLESLLKPEE